MGINDAIWPCGKFGVSLLSEPVDHRVLHQFDWIVTGQLNGHRDGNSWAIFALTLVVATKISHLDQPAIGWINASNRFEIVAKECRLRRCLPQTRRGIVNHPRPDISVVEHCQHMGRQGVLAKILFGFLIVRLRRVGILDGQLNSGGQVPNGRTFGNGSDERHASSRNGNRSGGHEPLGFSTPQLFAANCPRHKVGGDALQTNTLKGQTIGRCQIHIVLSKTGGTLPLNADSTEFVQSLDLHFQLHADEFAKTRNTEGRSNTHHVRQRCVWMCIGEVAQ